MTRILVSQALLSGIFFGIYPLLLNYSGVGGNLRAAVWCLLALIGVTPFALWSGTSQLASANWWALGGAGVLGALALVLLNGFLAGAKPENAGQLFVLMNVTQIAAGALYFVMMNGWHLPIDKAAGFILAGVVAWLLLR